MIYYTVYEYLTSTRAQEIVADGSSEIMYEN